jgi:hypothetical protein
MKCENVLCRQRTANKDSRCHVFPTALVAQCLQYHLFNEVIIQTERKTTATFSNIIHDAANQVQKENF